MKNGSSNHSFELGLIQSDADGLCRAMSTPLIEWIGLKSGELIGQFLFQIFPPEVKKEVLSHWERIVLTKDAGRFESVIRSTSGTLLPVSVEVSPIRGINSLTDHWVVALSPRRHGVVLDEGEIHLLKAELSDTRQRSEAQLGALKEEIAQIQRAKDILFSSLEEESQKKIAALEGELAELRLAATTRSEATASSTAQPLSAAPSSAPPPVEELATLRAHNLTLLNRVRSAEEEMTTLRRQIAAYQDDTTQKTSQQVAFEELTRELTDLRATRDALLAGAEKEIERKVAETTLQASQTAQASADAKNQELGALRSELAQERELRLTESRETARLQEDLRTLRETSASRLQDFEKQLTDASAHVARHEATIAHAAVGQQEAQARIVELEREAMESSQFAQTAAREFKELLRQHDEVAMKLKSVTTELEKSKESLQQSIGREEHLTQSLRSAQREHRSLCDERDIAQSERARLERQLREQSNQLSHTTGEVLERIIAEVATRVNRIMRLFYHLPDLKPDAPLCRATAAARTAAEDLLAALENIYEFWLMEAGGLALTRENFPLRAWLTRTEAVYDFKASQRDLSITVSTDPQIPELVLTDGSRLAAALTQSIDYIVETAEPRSTVSLSTHVLNATPRGATVAFEIESPSGGDAQTAGQQLSLTVAERIVKLLGGEMSVSEVPGASRRITLTVTFIRGEGAPSPLVARSNRRIPREDIAPLPVRPTTAPLPESPRAFGVHEGSQHRYEDDVDADGMVSIESSSPHAVASSHQPRGLEERRSPFSPTHPSAPSHPAQPVEPPTDSLEEPIKPRGVPAPVDAEAPDEPSPQAAGPLRILLAEDNRLNQRMIGDILRTRGYEVVIAADGREALTHFTTSRFDLALIDCEMPTMDGYAATREMRGFENRARRHTPVFAMTVYLDEDIQARCRDVGMDELLTKPVRADQLFQLIDRYFPADRS